MLGRWLWNMCTKLMFLKVLRDHQEYQHLGLLRSCIARCWRHVEHCEAEPYLQSLHILAETFGTGACVRIRVTEKKLHIFHNANGTRLLRHKAFRFSFAC